MTTLYIAGPMTGLPDYNYPAFNDAEAKLTAVGYKVLNPARKEGREGCETWQDFMRASLRDLADCDGVALLDGWEDSRGANAEVLIARQIEIKVMVLGIWLERAAIENPAKLAKIAALAVDWGHTGHDDDPEPDCAACWAAFILAILGGES